MNDRTYWLVELQPRDNTYSWSPIYYTAPHIWGSAVDLATKFHTEVAARAEAAHLNIPAAHTVIAVQHSWSD